MDTTIDGIDCSAAVDYMIQDGGFKEAEIMALRLCKSYKIGNYVVPMWLRSKPVKFLSDKYGEARTLWKFLQFQGYVSIQ
jgi:hypothetical protein